MNCANETELWKVIVRIKEALYALSAHKYGSNVVECLVDNLSISQQIMVVELFLEDPKKAHELSLDPFGNYVMQKLLLCGSLYQKYQVHHNARLVFILQIRHARRINDNDNNIFQ